MERVHFVICKKLTKYKKYVIILFIPMNKLLQTTISLLISSIVMINGISVRTDDIVAKTNAAVNNANLHQIATALELYYSNHDYYPKTQSGEELVILLVKEGYIMNQPSDVSTFEYVAVSNGQDYRLALAK